MVSHAAYPTPMLLSDRLRIFFNTRDADNRGCLAWIDVDPKDPRRVLDIAKEPSLTHGPPGTFDDRGLSNGSIHRVGGELWLYYMGWNKAADVPFRNAIGLAVNSDGNGSLFKRVFEGPLIDRSRFDPFTISYPFVMPAESGGAWRMYYGSSRGAGDRVEGMLHVLTEATSHDGIDWQPTGREVVALEAGEYGLSRPWLLPSGDRASLLFSIRREQYRIGLATRDPRTGAWRRVTNDLLGPSSEDWDSEAACYPAAIDIGGTRFLFYCGNGYGRTGFGLATLED